MKFPDFSSILCDFPGLFQSIQNSLTVPIFKGFASFPVRVGTLMKLFFALHHAFDPHLNLILMINKSHRVVNKVQSNQFAYWSFAEKTFVKQSMMVCAFEILLKIGWFEVGGKSYLAIWGVNLPWWFRGQGGKSYRRFGVNHTWRFEGKSSVRFTPPEIVKSDLVTWDSLSDI